MAQKRQDKELSYEGRGREQKMANITNGDLRSKEESFPDMLVETEHNDEVQLPLLPDLSKPTQMAPPNIRTGEESEKPKSRGKRRNYNKLVN